MEADLGASETKASGRAGLILVSTAAFHGYFMVVPQLKNPRRV